MGKRRSDTQNRHHVINDALRGVLRDVGRTTLEEEIVRALYMPMDDGLLCAVHKSDGGRVKKEPEKTSKALSGETIDQQQENDLMAE